jgi:hypothetical protein
MAESSCSSDYAANSTDGKVVALDSLDDGPSEVLRVGVKRRTREAERSSVMEHLNNSQKEKGKAIISGAGDFDEITGRKVATPNNLEAEIDGPGAASIKCRYCFRKHQFENMVQCRNGHWICFKCITKRIHEIIYGDCKAHEALSCIAILAFCNELIPLSEIRRALPKDVMEWKDMKIARPDKLSLKRKLKTWFIAHSVTFHMK